MKYRKFYYRKIANVGISVRFKYKTNCLDTMIKTLNVQIRSFEEFFSVITKIVYLLLVFCFLICRQRDIYGSVFRFPYVCLPLLGQVNTHLYLPLQNKLINKRNSKYEHSEPDKFFVLNILREIKHFNVVCIWLLP